MYLHALAKLAMAEGIELKSLSVKSDTYRWVIRKCNCKFIRDSTPA